MTMQAVVLMLAVRHACWEAPHAAGPAVPRHSRHPGQLRAAAADPRGRGADPGALPDLVAEPPRPRIRARAGGLGHGPSITGRRAGTGLRAGLGRRLHADLPARRRL